MDGTTSPEIALALTMVALVLSTSALVGSVFTWFASRAHKVRFLETELRERSDRVEMKLAEWQTTLTSMLAEVEEFFERTVKERKRITRRTDPELPTGPVPFDQLSREEQKEVVRLHFAGQQ